ncbi:hypothetical protein L3X38_045370 [Prunus dulcis]|uniref:Aminotransferase-like plant mobile domain-containing protein n=1 Tax=Prunus dulcis TaxID=3755 RepID=A0AAD4YPA4_PRUDU|nr:hypothetical protein L3X38_045370 [Prunus dulcis]
MSSQGPVLSLLHLQFLPITLLGAGLMLTAIEVRSKLHPFAQKNLDENILHLFENTLCEVRNSPVKWADRIDKLLPRYGGHWRRAGIYDAILLSKQSINRDENLLAAALCFWNSASNTFDFRVGPMAPTLLDMAQIFGFRAPWQAC